MLPKELKNFSLFIDGRGYAGRIDEITLPKLVNRTEEFRLGGLGMPVQVDMGMEKLECELTLSEYDTTVIKLFGIEDSTSLPIPLRGGLGLGTPLAGVPSAGQIPFTMRGGLSDEINNIVPITVYLEGSVIELDFGQWKPGQSTSLRIRVAARYYRLHVDGETLIEIDADNKMRKVDDINQISTSSGLRRNNR